jgi:hypothetical protein
VPDLWRDVFARALYYLEKKGFVRSLYQTEAERDAQADTPTLYALMDRYKTPENGDVRDRNLARRLAADSLPDRRIG